MTSETMAALAERVEALTGPCRETDMTVKAAVYGGVAMLSPFNGRWCIYRVGQEHLDMRARKTMERPRDVSHEIWNADTYTASLDAAMTLVPEGFGWQHSSMTGTCVVGVVNGKRVQWGHHDTSPALALTAAALRARAAMEDTQ